MAKTKNVIDMSELDMLETAADRGNADAERELRRLNDIYSRRASQRMRELERHDMNTGALSRAYLYLEDRGRSRFGAGKTADLDEVIENLEQARKFLTWETSTVGGEKARVNSMLESLEKNGIISEFSSEQSKRSFLRFLESDAFADYKKSIGSSVIAEAQNAIENGATIAELTAAYESYKAGEVDLIESWESWAEI